MQKLLFLFIYGIAAGVLMMQRDSAGVESLIIPPPEANSFSPSRGGIMGGEPYQVCYNARNFASIRGPILISEIAYRVDEDTPKIDLVIPTLEIRASTFTNTIQNLSVNWSINRGSDDTLVFFGTNVHVLAERNPSDPHDFQVPVRFQTPFLYDPSAGHLLLEIPTDEQSYGSLGWTDSSFGDSDFVFKVRNLAGFSTIVDGGDVLKLSYTSVPGLSVSVARTNVAVGSFFALAGRAYEVQFKSTLDSVRSWTTITNFPSGSDREISFECQLDQAQKYFHLLVK